MERKRVFSYDALPARLPIPQTVITALALDHWHAPAWLWGAMGTLFLILWISVAVSMAHEDRINPFSKGEKLKPLTKEEIERLLQE